MTIPILNSKPGTCLACKGPLTPQHTHSYQDDALMAFLDGMTLELANTGCLIVGQDNSLYLGHPQLKAGYMWMPVKITHIGPHEECDIKVPHHHCDNSL